MEEMKMLYPVYVCKEAGSAYGATVPDMPGVNTAADNLEDLPAMVQEAAELMFEGEPEGPKAPTDIERWASDKNYAGGFWMLFDVDLSKLSTKAIRLNISLPENLVHRIDAVARKRHLSRSAFLASLAQTEVQRMSELEIWERSGQ
jgi:predicted RNase H-like HicB family nuclease